MQNKTKVFDNKLRACIHNIKSSYLHENKLNLTRNDVSTRLNIVSNEHYS